MAEILTQTHEKSGALGYALTDTECGREYLFVMHGNHVVIHPADDGWRENLTQEEKLLIFNKILADFRVRTVGDGGFKLAALGITEDGRIYISGNAGESQSSDAFQRVCAERSMIKIASERDSYEQIGENPDLVDPHLLNFEAVYLMGGRPPEIPIACPCGDCTDMLAKRMEENGQIVVIPSNDGDVPLTINRRVEYASELKPNEVWDTTIGHLNRYRTIDLNGKADIQTDAMRALAEELSAPLTEAFKHDPVKLIAGYRDAVPPLRDSSQIMNKNGQNNAATINRFMSAHIKTAIVERLQGVIARNGATDLSPDGIMKLMNDHIKNIRCIVVEMDNGKRYSAIATKVPGVDNALPPGEIGALFAASSETGTNGICQAWCMEFNPALIAEGKMGTPPKQAIERLVKRRSEETDQLDFNFIPFNNGDLSPPRVDATVDRRNAKSMFPGYFAGKEVDREWAHRVDRGQGCSRC